MSLATIQEYQSSHLLEGKAGGGDYAPAEIQRYLDAATGYVEAMCNQRLVSTEETEIWRVGTIHASVDHQGILTCTPRFFPVTAITSIKYRITPATAWADSTAFSAAQYSAQQLSFSGGSIIEVLPYVHWLRRGLWAEVQAVYTHGYTVLTAPAELKQAIVLVAYALISVGFAVLELDTNQVRTLIPNWMWSSYVKPVIARYTRQF